jgi:zinc transporter ZupT
VALNGPECLAVGVALSFGSIAVLLVLEIYVSNIPQALVRTVWLRRSGHSPKEISLHWLIVILALLSICMISFELMADVSQTYRAAVLGLAAGGMQSFQSEEGSEQSFSTGTLGALAASRFAIASSWGPR